MNQVGVVRKLNTSLGLERLQGLKLELLVILFDNRVLDKVNSVISAPNLLLICMDVLDGIPSMLRELLDEILRRVVKANEHSIQKTVV